MITESSEFGFLTKNLYLCGLEFSIMAIGGDIIIKGARVNNLKNVDVAIPRGKFVVVTGLSGSGKSSLAFERVCRPMRANSWGA